MRSETKRETSVIVKYTVNLSDAITAL